MLPHKSLKVVSILKFAYTSNSPKTLYQFLEYCRKTMKNNRECANPGKNKNFGSLTLFVYSLIDHSSFLHFIGPLFFCQKEPAILMVLQKSFKLRLFLAVLLKVSLFKRCLQINR